MMVMSLGSTSSEGSVTAVSGVNQVTLGGYAGKTIADLRSASASVLRMDANAIATCSGVVIEDSSILETGDIIEFVKASGSKGV